MAKDAVDRVLAERGQAAERSRRAEIAALSVAALLHLGVVAVAFGLAHLKPHQEPIEFIAAQIVPAQALGVEKPRKRAEAPKPAPPAPVTEPAAEPEPEPPAPEPEPVQQPVPPPVPTGPLPRPKGWNDPPPAAAPAKPTATPAPTKPAAPTTPPAKPPAPVKPPTPAKPGTGTGAPGPGADVAKGTEAGPRGSSAGTAAGTSPFGDRIASIDPDFTYGYYIEQLLRQIDAMWTRPQAGTNIRTIVRFRILRRGDIDQLAIAESSGINAFDLAALRAVQNASPFPPLPASYRNPTLNVTLIVR
ncbi:MAG: energy transducer TonB [Acidobacteriota bacterium]